MSELSTLRAENKRLWDALCELYGQVKQAREGFGVYHNSPSMDIVMTKAQAALEERHE